MDVDQLPDDTLRDDDYTGDENWKDLSPSSDQGPSHDNDDDHQAVIPPSPPRPLGRRRIVPSFRSSSSSKSLKSGRCRDLRATRGLVPLLERLEWR